MPILKRRSGAWGFEAWGLLVGFWILVGLLYVGMFYAGHLLTGEALPERFSPLWGLLGWCTWIPATPLVLWLVRRFPIDRRHWAPAALLHLGAAFGTSLFTSLLYTVMRAAAAVLSGTEGFAFAEHVQGTFARSVGLDSVIYLTVLAAVHAFEYYRRYRAGRLQAAQLEASLAEAQLHALNLQLRPHFLFNTFHTVAMLVRRRRDEEAVETIAVLSEFLRHVLDYDRVQEVTLAQELRFLESYLAIERVRFKEQLDVQTHIDPEAQSAAVPSLILQPLVENAVRHGRTPEGQSVHIEVVARREGEQLRLRVQDRGAGLQGQGAALRSGVGLTNTRKRLDRLYGAAHRLELSDVSEGHGLMVTVVIPYHRMADAPQPATPPPTLASSQL